MALCWVLGGLEAWSVEAGEAAHRSSAVRAVAAGIRGTGRGTPGLGGELTAVSDCCLVALVGWLVSADASIARRGAGLLAAGCRVCARAPDCAQRRAPRRSGLLPQTRHVEAFSWPESIERSKRPQAEEPEATSGRP